MITAPAYPPTEVEASPEASRASANRVPITPPRLPVIAACTSVRPSRFSPKSALALSSSIDDIDAAGQHHGQHDIQPDGPQDSRDPLGVRFAVPVADQRRVQVDRVRHHGGAQHAHREQGAVHAGQPGLQPAQRALGVGRGDDQAGEEADR